LPSRLGKVQMKDRLWAIILAGGEGTRLAETARRVYGSCLPKQFLGFGQQRTLLQATIDRVLPLIPADRTVVVVPSSHEQIAREQLIEFDGIEIVVQPANRGTVAGVLLPLVHVLSRDARAEVALIPSDHDFQAPSVMLETLNLARHASKRSGSMVLIGAAAEAPASDLGWIVTKKAPTRRAVRRIERFVEKPPQPVAEELFHAGALWNTMLSVAPGEALLRLARSHAPEQAALFDAYALACALPGAAARLAHVYDQLRPADFSRDLVAVSRGLLAAPMLGAGWSDCGTPERLQAAFGKSFATNIPAALAHAVGA
jgi:mannose-1-phosphate guanylyltransferase